MNITAKDLKWWIDHLESKPDEDKVAFMRIAPEVCRMALATFTPSPWERESQQLVLAALEWERLRRGMPGSTPETIAAAETAFWQKAKQVQGVKVAMLQQHIADARAASPDGKTQWDRVEEFRLEHGHLPGEKEEDAKTCAKCKAGIR